jgi:hypothetical protein
MAQPPTGHQSPPRAAEFDREAALIIGDLAVLKKVLETATV